MRSLPLHDALAELAQQVAARLHADVAAGQEVQFELHTRSGRGSGAPALYCYRPLTHAFIAERLPEVRALDAYPAAARLLEGFDALDRFLLACGEQEDPRRPRPCTDAALLALLALVFDEQTDFQLRPERLARALERLDGAAFAAPDELALIATLHGLAISSSELALARGLAIVRPDALDGVPPQALRAGADSAGHLLVVYRATDADPSAALARGAEILRELLRALRLFGDGRIALGPRAWTRVGEEPWETIALGRGGHPHGMLLVRAEQEDELRAFCNLVARRTPQQGPIAWALRRFELGCERHSEYDALSDHLLALRALLGPPTELQPAGAPEGQLAARLAALCATPDARRALIERTLAAIALEREQIAGAAEEHAAGLELVRDLAGHLRALLRDTICNYLPADLVSLADELLVGGVESAEQPVRDEREPTEILHVTVQQRHQLRV